MEVQELVGLVSSSHLQLEAMDRAAFATLDGAVRELKAAAEEVEAGREELVAKYSNELGEGGGVVLVVLVVWWWRGLVLDRAVLIRAASAWLAASSALRYQHILISRTLHLATAARE
jgi:hypothetical protein